MSRLRNVADAFDVNVARVHPKPVRQRRQDADLVQRIMAVNVERGLRLGVTLRLGVLEHGIEIRALELHPGEDVIAGAVDDAIEMGDAVADETFAQALDDGNAAADAGFVVNVGSIFPRSGEELLAVRRQQRLVGGDDRFAELEGGEDHRPGRCRSRPTSSATTWTSGSLTTLCQSVVMSGFRDLVWPRLIESLHRHLANVDLHPDP